MFQFVGYNFFSDKDCLNNAPASVENITTIELTNAIFDHLNITKNIETPFTFDKPDKWDYDTILNADFNGDLNGGNVEFLIEQISAMKIKRRKKGTFNWITLKTFKIEKVDDLKFIFNDRLNADMVEYDYAFVPILNDIEGNYIINSILSKFNGVFIGDADTTFRLLYDVSYGNNNRNQQVGTFQPLGRQYPVIVANGLMSYESGSVAATILNDDFQDEGKLNKPELLKKKNLIKEFLTNRRAKILKDWAGNIWLCMIVDNPQVAYMNGTGMSVPHIAFNWTEIGNSESQRDLYNNGLVESLT